MKRKLPRVSLSRIGPNVLSRLIGPWAIDAIHAFWYRAPDTWRRNTYCGHEIQQIASDMWLYQEIIYRERPAFVLQTGVKYGGSLLYFAHILDAIGADPAAPVIGVDVELTPEARRLTHPRIHLIAGDSAAPETIRAIRERLPAPTGLVSLDSDHSREHVLRELAVYPQFVGVGQHLVVEDTNINAHPVYPSFGPGPYEAVREFLKTNRDFVQDNDLWRRNHFSFHQYGWLKRVR